MEQFCALKSHWALFRSTLCTFLLDPEALSYFKWFVWILLLFLIPLYQYFHTYIFMYVCVCILYRIYVSPSVFVKVKIISYLHTPMVRKLNSMAVFWDHSLFLG